MSNALALKQKAAIFTLKSELSIQLSTIIRANEWTPVEAGRRCGLSQPLVEGLLQGDVGDFSLDGLVNIAGKLGCKIRVEMTAL